MAPGVAKLQNSAASKQRHRERLHQCNSMPPERIEILSPPGAIKPTGTWSLGVRAGDFVFVAGMRGIDPATDVLVEGAEARVRQAFLNMKAIVEGAGGGLPDAVRLVVYVTDMYRYRPIVNKVQEELWGDAPYPPRTIVEVDRLNQDDIVEVEGTFYCPAKIGR
jgi:2-iminobutanoate/2-iminopropanoate deaminase